MSGIRIRLLDSLFTALTSNVGYPITTALVAFFYHGVDAPSTAKNQVVGGTNGSVAGTLDYFTSSADNNLGKLNNLRTGVIDTTQDITLISIHKPTGTILAQQFFALVSNLNSTTSDSSVGLERTKTTGAEYYQMHAQAASGALTSQQFASIPAPAVSDFVFVFGRISGAVITAGYIINGVITKATASVSATRVHEAGQLQAYSFPENTLGQQPSEIAFTSIHKAAIVDADLITIYNALVQHYNGLIVLN